MKGGVTMLFHGEKEAIERVLDAGKTYGYGNMIAHLKRAWAKLLIIDGLSEEHALEAADTSAYPIKEA